jgi:hypothetical protein
MDYLNEKKDYLIGSCVWIIKNICSTRFSNNPNSFVTMDKNSNFLHNINRLDGF